MVLPFDIYDFSVIPIETISGRLRRLYPGRGLRGAAKKGSFLHSSEIGEFTVDLANGGEFDLTGRRALDPGCGSGVFLVSVFNRMAEGWVRRNEKTPEWNTRSRPWRQFLREQNMRRGS